MNKSTNGNVFRLQIIDVYLHDPPITAWLVYMFSYIMFLGNQCKL